MAQQPEVQSAARDAVEWRHHIHQNPELSFEEYKTSNYVADLLASFGHIEVLRPTKTSVIGILRGGKPGKTVGFRADMDALPVQEETGFSFASKTPGVSHACGHDMHTAMLLGTARVLASMQKELPGTVYFIFQPGEEKSPGGALPIIKSGALKGVDAIFGACDAQCSRGLHRHFAGRGRFLRLRRFFPDHPGKRFPWLHAADGRGPHRHGV